MSEREGCPSRELRGGCSACALGVGCALGVVAGAGGRAWAVDGGTSGVVGGASGALAIGATSELGDATAIPTPIRTASTTAASAARRAGRPPTDERILAIPAPADAPRPDAFPPPRPGPGTGGGSNIVLGGREGCPDAPRGGSWGPRGGSDGSLGGGTGADRTVAPGEDVACAAPASETSPASETCPAVACAVVDWPAWATASW